MEACSGWVAKCLPLALTSVLGRLQSEDTLQIYSLFELNQLPENTS